MADVSTSPSCPGCPDALFEEWLIEKYRDTVLPCSICGLRWDFAPRQVHWPKPAPGGGLPAEPATGGELAIGALRASMGMRQTIEDILKVADRGRRTLSLN